MQKNARDKLGGTLSGAHQSDITTRLGAAHGQSGGVARARFLSRLSTSYERLRCDDLGALGRPSRPSGWPPRAGARARLPRQAGNSPRLADASLESRVEVGFAGIDHVVSRHVGRTRGAAPEGKLAGHHRGSARLCFGHLRTSRSIVVTSIGREPNETDYHDMGLCSSKQVADGSALLVSPWNRTSASDERDSDCFRPHSRHAHRRSNRADSNFARHANLSLVARHKRNIRQKSMPTANRPTTPPTGKSFKTPICTLGRWTADGNAPGDLPRDLICCLHWMRRTKGAPSLSSWPFLRSSSELVKFEEQARSICLVNNRLKWRPFAQQGHLCNVPAQTRQANASVRCSRLSQSQAHFVRPRDRPRPRIR
jgi:hypothetical protein